jgi:hypothetical protein
MAGDIVARQIPQGLDAGFFQQIAVMADQGRVIVPAAAGAVGGQLLALLVDALRIPDGFKIGFANGTDADVLFQARVNMAPGIDASHQYRSKALLLGIRTAGFQAFYQAVQVAVFGQRGCRDLFGDYIGIQLQGIISTNTLIPGFSKIKVPPTDQNHSGDSQ